MTEPDTEHRVTIGGRIVVLRVDRYYRWRAVDDRGIWLLEHSRTRGWLLGWDDLHDDLVCVFGSWAPSPGEAADALVERMRRARVLIARALGGSDE